MTSSGLGVKLKQLREARGLTQQELAGQAGVSWSTISKLEQGTVRKPSVQTLQKLISVLRYDLDVLLSDKPLPPSSLQQPAKTTKTPIKFVYFDIGGVMAHTESMLLQYLAARLDRPLDKVKHLYYQYSPIAMRGRLALEDIQLLFLFKLNVDYSHYKKFIFTDWVEHMKPNTLVHEFAFEVSKIHPVGLLTNIISGVYPRMKKLKLVPDLPYKVVVESCKEGLIKPEPAIYLLAAQKAGVDPSEILFIDDRKINVKAAKAAGWHAEWFNEVKTEASLARIRRKYF